MKRLLTLALVGSFAAVAHAQPAADPASPLERGKEAYRAGRHADAARFFEDAARADDRSAQAHYFLARVLADTVLNERGKAAREVERALALDPDNVEYLVARLVLLRDDAPTFIQDRIREQRRIELARKILRTDSSNAFAHEDLGRVAVRDFWRYRNAVMLPQLSTQAPLSSSESGQGGPSLVATEDDPNNPTGAGSLGNRAATALAAGSTDDPNAVFRADQFDLGALRTQGVPVVSLAGRAQRAYRVALAHFETALASDPFRREVYDDLMRLYALKGEWAAALGKLDNMYAFFPEDPMTWAYLGMAHLRAGNGEAADRAFVTALRYAPTDMKRAYESVDLLTTTAERERARGGDADAFAARFWTSEDPRLLTSFNERKLEHYARLTYADLLYGAPALKRRGWNTQRGAVVVRYGPPPVDVTIVPQTFSSAVRRALFEPRAQQRRLDELAGMEGEETTRGSSLIRVGERRPTFEDRTDFGEDLNTFNVWDYGAFRFVFEDPFRNGEFRLYTPPADDVTRGTDPWLNDYAMRARETFERTPERYTYRAPGRQVELPYLVSTFRGERGQTDVYVHYGVAVPTYDASAERVDLNANTGTFLVSANREVLVERRRTLYGLRTAQIVRFAETNLWVDTQEMSAPPGAHELSVEFETASGGTVAVQRRAVDVPRYSDDRFELSSLMLAYKAERTPDGRPLAGGEIVRNGLSIRPAPWSVFRRANPITLYFEIYNLAAGADGRTNYDVELTLAPKNAGRGVSGRIRRLMGREYGVSVKYPGSGTLRSLENAPSLDASGEEPGLYTLTLTVNDKVSRRTETRTVDLFLE